MKNQVVFICVIIPIVILTTILTQTTSVHESRDLRLFSSTSSKEMLIPAGCTLEAFCFKSTSFCTSVRMYLSGKGGMLTTSNDTKRYKMKMKIGSKKKV